MFIILDYSSALEYSIIRRYTNIVLYIILYVDKCVLFTFAPPIIPIIDVPGHDLNPNVSLN